jgi:glycosyltransferase involved in cell wall biosynthesis
MLVDRAARARARAGMERARAELTWEKTARMTLDLYGRALAQRRGPAH